jgi:hypothetical protein
MSGDAALGYMLRTATSCLLHHDRISSVQGQLFPKVGGLCRLPDYETLSPFLVEESSVICLLACFDPTLKFVFPFCGV